MSEETPIAAAGPAGREAAAILLMLLAEDEAATVLSRLDPSEVEELGEAMYAVADVTESQINSVLDDFVERARTRTSVGFGADAQIRGVMTRALGDERAETVLSRIAPPATTGGPLDALLWMDADAVASAITGEHPQICATVLAHVEPEKAAAALAKLDESIQADIVYRIARLGPVTQSALDEIERLLANTKRTPQPSAQSRRGGASEAAKIVNNAPTTAETQRLVRQLTKLDKNLARMVEDEMFVFDNLSNVSEKDLGTLFRSVENELVIIGLKSCDERLRGRILGSMSARAAQSIQDEMNERGPMRLAEVQEAQKAILAIARRLADEGTISLGGKGEDYV
jgi:flagellar motor switch protein FliG